MKRTSKFVSIGLALIAAVTLAHAQSVPQKIHFQGRIDSGGVPYNGTGYFKFAIVNMSGTETRWSNDGTSSVADEPTDGVMLTVSDGVFSVLLGDRALPHMELLPPEVFGHQYNYLRVWFDDGSGAFTQLSPDHRIVSAGYAMKAARIDEGAVSAASIESGAVTSSTIADDAVTSAKLAEGSVGSRELAESISLGKIGTAGNLKLFGGIVASSSLTLPTISLEGATGKISTESGFRVGVFGTSAWLSDETTGGQLAIYDETGKGASKLGAEAGGGGALLLFQADGSTVGIDLSGDVDGGNSGGRIKLNQGDGDVGVYIDGDQGGAGYISVRDASGNVVIKLDGDKGGDGRITTEVLEITGGADLSEQFQVTTATDSAQPGMVVCIDPHNPGALRVSEQAYDRTVAGIVSGAGGVKPGMLMGQHGTLADGQHPVALTGRVYCFADATREAILPGDLLTTSTVPGHAMKAADFEKAHGAIIGKAMTALESGTGQVLVLVNLQ